jgi:hypothetical protein
LFDQIENKFKANLKEKKNFADTELFVMLIIFYSYQVVDFKMPKNVFYYHDAQSKDYYNFLLKNFSRENLKE